jgi:hypothetical protein
MGDVSNYRQIRSAARILLICPDCGHGNAEFVDKLRASSAYFCNGEGCDYKFDLVDGPRRHFGSGFTEACKRFYAALYGMRRSSSGEAG